MEFINSTLSAMHLPGLNFLETVGAGAAMYFGVVAARAFIGFAGWALQRTRGLAKEADVRVAGRRR